MRHRAGLCGGLTALVAAVIVLASAVPALADRPLQSRFSANADGGIAVAANTLESCGVAVAGCDAARGGVGSLLDDNDFTMQYVDVDGDPATFDSSSARLSLPAGARVLFAGLYVGGRTEVGTRGVRPRDASPEALRRVLVRGPGSGSYADLGPGDATLDQSSSVKGAYQSVHDVTDLVRREGAGVYTVADVQAATGIDRYAGWSLVVAYAAPGEPPRNLSVFDGLQSVTRGQPPLRVPVSGFLTPPSGPVRTQVGVVAYEGDLGSGGDGMALDGHPLSDAASPVGNFFDSGISIDGVPSSEKTPDYRNQLGFDAKLVRADGALPDGARAATITLTTSLEQYLPGAVAFATDLYAPDLRIDKTVENLTQPGAPARPGDHLRYTLAYHNEGQDTAHDAIASDQLPDGVTLVPGSLRLTTGDLSSPALTDPAGDDLGEYDPSTRTVRFFLGTGADAIRGGEIPPVRAAGGGGETTASFEVEVDPTPRATTLTNSATVTATATALDQPLQAISDPATIEARPADEPVPVADISASEDATDAHAGDVSETSDIVTVTDRGPADATAIRATIPIPVGESVASVHVPDGDCTIDGAELSCVIPRLEAGASAEIDLVEQHTGAEHSVPPTEVTATAHQLDENASDNAAITPRLAAAPVLPTRDDATLQTTIRAATRSAQVGQVVDETVAVRDLGPGTAHAVTVDATPSLPVGAVTASGPGWRCHTALTIRCATATLAAGDTRRLRISARPRRPGELNWTVDAASDRFSPHPGRQTAHTSVRIRGTERALAISLRPPAGGLIAGHRADLLLQVRDLLPVAVTDATICVHAPPSLHILTGPTSQPLARRSECRTHLHLHPGASTRLTAHVIVATSSPGRLTLTTDGRIPHVPPARLVSQLEVHPPFTGCLTLSTPPLALGPDC